MSAAAQADNLGDAVLRSVAVEWLSGAADLCVSVGRMPPGYINVVDPAGRHVVSESEGMLVRRLLRERHPVLVFAPGEQMLTSDRREVARQLLGIAVSAAVKIRGGSVIKLPRGYRGRSRLAIALERVQLAACTLAWTRDAEASRMFPGLASLPDVAVASTQLDQEATDSQRDAFTVSLRSDRAGVSGPTFLRLAGLVRERTGLRTLAAVQVERDEDAVTSFAELADAELVGWSGEHADQLRRVLTAYDRSRIVISDRLHVLLFAARRGALPIGVETGSADKLRRQLTPYGLADLVLDAGDPEEHLRQIVAQLETHSDRAHAAVDRARVALERARAEVRTVVLP